MRGP